MRIIIILVFWYACFSLDAQDTTTLTWQKVQHQPSEWYGSDQAKRIADNVLLYQNENGGWPKNIDMAKVLSDKECNAIKQAQLKGVQEYCETTIDNGATHTEIRFLAKVYEKTGQQEYAQSFLKGVDYLLAAQYENGGWPQFYPLKEGYYIDITFNDGAMIGVMNLLNDIAKGKFDFVDEQHRQKATQAIQKGIDIILKTQIEVSGKKTAWCAQYDPHTLEPAKARAYELVSISGGESVEIVEFLMGIDHPDEQVIQAVKSAVSWFDQVKITGLRLIKKPDPSLKKGYDLIVGFDPISSDTLWARFYEIGTNYPIFVDRSGVVEYALSEIDYERRVGYRWFGDWAKHLLNKDYREWCEKWAVTK